MHPCPAYKCRGWDGNPTLTDAPMCDYHTRKVAEALDELPRLYVRLHTAMARGDSVSHGGRVRVTKSPPLPINVAARSLQEDMLTVVRDAEAHYRARRHWPRNRRRGLEAQILDARCKWLIKHHEAVLDVDVDYGVRILALKHQARSLLGITPLVHKLIGVPCPDCEHCALVRKDGSSYVECRMCLLSFDQDNYGRLVLVLASDLPPMPKITHHSAHGKPEDTTQGFGW